MKYKKNQDKKTVVAVVPVDLMAETADSYEWDSSANMDGQIVSANAQRITLDNEKLVKMVFVKRATL